MPDNRTTTITAAEFVDKNFAAMIAGGQCEVWYPDHSGRWITASRDADGDVRAETVSENGFPCTVSAFSFRPLTVHWFTPPYSQGWLDDQALKARVTDLERQLGEALNVIQPLLEVWKAWCADEGTSDDDLFSEWIAHQYGDNDEALRAMFYNLRRKRTLE